MAERATQGNDLIFALDIGTRSVIGVVGKPAGDRLKVLGIEAAEHGKRAMLDGQIDDIESVAALVRTVTQRLEDALGIQLRRVFVAAAGRALRTQNGAFALELTGDRPITTEQISQLEAGAVSAAEAGLQLEDNDAPRQFFLVGYTVVQYRLDQYPLTTLYAHNGRLAEADVVATFLPAEVVESLYAAMQAAGLQVAGMTLEPIAAMNAAIPAELRLLNLALVDIGAGTTDIAACRDGGVVGYTMATVAGDEVTEAIMRAFLVDFQTAERIKRALNDEKDISFTDILGIEQRMTRDQVAQAVEESVETLAEAVSRQVAAVNGGAPSALFLAGGGSKLAGLRERIAARLGMDARRVAIAGGNFSKSVFSEDLTLENPEYATPLGIAVSAGMGLLNDSYMVQLNGVPAKLFRSGTLTLQEILLMNGYTYADLIGKTGKGLTVVLDGKHQHFRGEPAIPALLRVNGKEAPITALIHAGDRIDFTPAKPGTDAARTLRQLLGPAFAGKALVNGREVPPDTPLKQGDAVLTRREPCPAGDAPSGKGPGLHVKLNDRPLALEGKADGTPYLLLDLLEYSGLDFKHLDRPVRLEVNGEERGFQYEVRERDSVTIRCIDTGGTQFGRICGEAADL